MATSEKQIAANQRNAKKSTGPTSPEGKAVASRNAIKHGLHACDIILKSPHLSEERADYEQLLDSLIDEFKPRGVLQEHLVLKIANSLWRYQRVINAETARINDQLETAAYDIERGRHLMFKSDPDDPEDPEEDRAEQLESNHAGARSVPSELFRKSLMYYEMRLDRQLTRSFRLLHQLQNPALSKPLSRLSQKSESTPNEPISDRPPEPAKPLPDNDNAPTTKE